MCDEPLQPVSMRVRLFVLSAISSLPAAVTAAPSGSSSSAWVPRRPSLCPVSRDRDGVRYGSWLLHGMR